MTRDERRWLWLMAAPFLLGVAALVAAPAIGTAVVSLFEWDLVTRPVFVGAANLRELADDPGFRRALGATLVFVAVAVPLRVAIALGIALALHRPGRLVTSARGAVVTPSIVPDAAMAVIWLWLLNPLYGPVNLVLGGLGLPTPAWLTEPSATRASVIVMSLFVVAEGFVIALAARRAIPAALDELAAAHGAGPLARTFRVTLPLMAPALLLMACRDTVAGFQATLVPALIVFDGGPPPDATTYLPFFIYREGFEYLRYGYAAAATLVLFAITAAAVWLQFRAVDGLRRGGLLRGALGPSG